MNATTTYRVLLSVYRVIYVPGDDAERVIPGDDAERVRLGEVVFVWQVACTQAQAHACAHLKLRTLELSLKMITSLHR